MFQKLEDFYTQDIRIDLTSAEQLATLNPEHSQYRAATERGAFVVLIMQGDVSESVYMPLMAQFFDTLAQAQSFCEQLKAEHPGASYFDFTSHPRADAAVSDEIDAVPRAK